MSSRVSAGKRKLGKAVLPAIAARKPVRAIEAVVLDGRTLHLLARRRVAQPGIISGELLFIRQGSASSATHRVPLQIRDGEFQLALPLDVAGLNLSQNTSWSVKLQSDQGVEPIGFVAGVSQTSPVLRNPPSRIDAVKRSVASSPAGELMIRITQPQRGIHVDFVGATLGRIRIRARAILAEGDRPTAVRYVARNVRLEHTEELTSACVVAAATGEAQELCLRVPTTQLARLVAEAGLDSDCVWDMQIVTDRTAQPLRMYLGDLKDPRLTFRYATTIDVTCPRKDRFRPYWTRGGKLALEHWFGPRP